MASKDQVITNFRRQTGKYTHGSKGREGDYNLFYEHQVLYSFGKHFPLALRYHSEKDIPESSAGFGCGIQYIINGDKYSVSTTQHQNQCISDLKPNVQIPFSALEEAWRWKQGSTKYYKEWGTWYTYGQALEIERKEKGLEPGSYVTMSGWGFMSNPEWVNGPNALAEQLLKGAGGFKIVAFQKDTSQYRYCVDKEKDDWTAWFERGSREQIAYAEKYDKDQYRHQLGAVLFTIRNNYFLSSFDEQDRSNYFLCQVPGFPASIEEAYTNLKPAVIQAMDNNGKANQYLRQGDWFFIPSAEASQAAIRKFAPSRERGHRLGGISGTHMVTEARFIPQATIADEAAGKAQPPWVYVKGMVRHSPTDGRSPEHRRLKLGDGKQWYVPVKNTSEAGWGAKGNVD